MSTKSKLHSDLHSLTLQSSFWQTLLWTGYEKAKEKAYIL